MELMQTRALRGPNLWSRYTALEMEVVCTPDECTIDGMPGFQDRLRSLCPGVADLRLARSAATCSALITITLSPQSTWGV